MPIFKTNKNVFEDHGEWYDQNWMDSDRIVLPETQLWDNSRELEVADVDLWEVISDFSGGGVYAAWKPYAPLYMVVLRKEFGGIKTWYGPTAEENCKKYMKEKHIPIPSHQGNPAYEAIEITESGINYKPVKKLADY
jgi:hypothetical protein